MNKVAFEARKIIRENGYDVKIVGEINGSIKLSIKLKDSTSAFPMDLRNALENNGISIDSNIGFMTDILGAKRAVISVYKTGNIEPAEPFSESLKKFNRSAF